MKVEKGQVEVLDKKTKKKSIMSEKFFKRTLKGTKLPGTKEERYSVVKEKAPKSSKDSNKDKPTAADRILKINSAETIEAVDALLKGEKAETVKTAAEARKKAIQEGGSGNE